MKFRQTDTPPVAAAKASFSTSTAYQSASNSDPESACKCDPHHRLRKHAVCGVGRQSGDFGEVVLGYGCGCGFSCRATRQGFDVAKNVFHVHGVDGKGQVILRKRLRRVEVIPFFANLSPCLIGMEACATAHHWARELQDLGHEMKLMPPAYVKPYGKRGKNDVADAEQKTQDLTAPKPSLQSHSARLIDAVHLEHILSQIEPNYLDRHHAHPSMLLTVKSIIQSPDGREKTGPSIPS